MISGAGHHVYADKAEIFNKHVLEACAISDNVNRLSSVHIRHPSKIPPRRLPPLPMDATDSKSEGEDDSDNVRKIN